MIDHTPTAAGQTETIKRLLAQWWTKPMPRHLDSPATNGEMIANDLVGYLQHHGFEILPLNSHATNLTRITELEAQVKALREALKPFAALCNDDLCPDGNDDDADWFRSGGYCLKNRDLRRARSLIPESNDGGEG